VWRRNKKEQKNSKYKTKCVRLCNLMCMRTNIDINDDLMVKAQKLSNIKTKKLMVEKALEVFIALENQKKILELWGKVEMDNEAYK